MRCLVASLLRSLADKLGPPRETTVWIEAPDPANDLAATLERRAAFAARQSIY